MPFISRSMQRVRQLAERCRLPAELRHPYPMLPLLLWLVVGVLPASLVALELASVWSSLAAGLAVAAATALLFGSVSWQRLLLAATGLLLAVLQAYAPWRTYPKPLIRNAAYAQLEGIVIDTGLPESEELQWLVDADSIRLAVRRLRLTEHEPWTNCRGTILVRHLPFEVRYGQRVQLEGALAQPWKPDLPGLFNYRNHLKIRGVAHILYAEQGKILNARPHGWRRGVDLLLRGREVVMERILRGIDEPANRAVLAAMTLGFRQGLSADDRTVYLRSGMIHLFAISGLHVGILFSVLLTLLLLVRVPFAPRYLIGPWLLLIYVIATGAAPSAVRAWLMITIWSTGRGLKLPVISVNAVLAAAFVLLLINPFYLFQSGFQFSFVIVLSLIWGWRQAQHFINYLNEKEHWIPARHRGRSGLWEKSRGFLLKSFMSMLCAWLGGIGLSAYYNQLFLPTSVFSNMAVFLLAFVIIWLSSIKVLLSFLFPWGLEAMTAWGLEWSVRLLRLLANLSSDHGAATLMPTPAIWAVFGYYVLLAALFLSANRLRRVAVTGALLGAVVAGMILWPRHWPSETRVTVMLPPGSMTPAVLVQPAYQQRHPILVNTGGRDLGYSLGDWLRHQGIETLDSIILTSNTREFYGGLPQLLEEVGTRALIVSAENRRQQKMLQTYAWDGVAHWRFHHQQDSFHIGNLNVRQETTPTDIHLTLTWQERAGPASLRVHATENAGCRLEYQEPSGRQRSWSLVYANHLRVIPVQDDFADDTGEVSAP